MRLSALRPQLKRDPLGRDDYTDYTSTAQANLQVHMLYVIIENFRGGDAVPVYRRFRDRGA